MTKTEKALRMRHQNQLNRHLGADFEELIGAACEYYRGRGVADIEKTPEEMKPIKNMGSGRFVAVYVKPRPTSRASSGEGWPSILKPNTPLPPEWSRTG